MASLPLSPSKIWDAWKDVTAASETQADLILTGDMGLVERARVELAPTGGAGEPGGHSRIWNGSAEGLAQLSLDEGDTLLVFAQPGDEDAWAGALKKRKPRAAVVVVDDGPAAGYEITWYRKNVYRVSFADDPRGWEKLAEAIVDANGERFVSLARRYPRLRKVAAHRVIEETSRQNGVVGVAFFVPGTDMPVMTLNQIKMVLSLAVMHGEELSRDRAVEILGVVGAGLGLRTVAREALGFIPGPGWALKGALGYSGTRAVGEAALRYFREDGDRSPGRFAKLLGKARESAPGVTETAGGAVASLGETATEKVSGLLKRFRS